MDEPSHSRYGHEVSMILTFLQALSLCRGEDDIKIPIDNSNASLGIIFLREHIYFDTLNIYRIFLSSIAKYVHGMVR